jgi:catechol 2,3-dioxygenase-like lactoylglutathione lyase family enzyme
VSFVDVLFVASVAPIVRDVDAARAFYQDALGLSLEGADGDYRFTQHLEGTKHFGLWPLAEAAIACFGTTEWPADIPVPQASIEFESPTWLPRRRSSSPRATSSSTTPAPNHGVRSPRGS